MAKSLKDILQGVKSSKKVTNDLGGYKPKAGDEEDFAKKHEIEKHEDRNGNGDDIYNATNVKHSMEKETRHGHKKPKDEKVYEEKKTCNMTEAGQMCEVHGMSDCSKGGKGKKLLKEKDPISEAWYSEKGGERTFHKGQREAMRHAREIGGKYGATHGAQGMKASKALGWDAREKEGLGIGLTSKADKAKAAQKQKAAKKAGPWGLREASLPAIVKSNLPVPKSNLPAVIKNKSVAKPGAPGTKPGMSDKMKKTIGTGAVLGTAAAGYYSLPDDDDDDKDTNPRSGAGAGANKGGGDFPPAGKWFDLDNKKDTTPIPTQHVPVDTPKKEPDTPKKEPDEPAFKPKNKESWWDKQNRMKSEIEDAKHEMRLKRIRAGEKDDDDEPKTKAPDDSSSKKIADPVTMKVTTKKDDDDAEPMDPILSVVKKAAKINKMWNDSMRSVKEESLPARIIKNLPAVKNKLPAIANTAKDAWGSAATMAAGAGAALGNYLKGDEKPKDTAPKGRDSNIKTTNGYTGGNAVGGYKKPDPFDWDDGKRDSSIRTTDDVTGGNAKVTSAKDYDVEPPKKPKLSNSSYDAANRKIDRDLAGGTVSSSDDDDDEFKPKVINGVTVRSIFKNRAEKDEHERLARETEDPNGKTQTFLRGLKDKAEKERSDKEDKFLDAMGVGGDTRKSYKSASPEGKLAALDVMKKDSEDKVSKAKKMNEALSKKADAGEWISDFVHSDNPKFKGKSKEKRKQMALAAYYAKQRNEEIEIEEALKGKQHKIDKNKNGKIDAQDFKLLRREKTVSEAVTTGNEGHGYHGEAYGAATSDDKMAEAGKAYAKAHALVKQHAAEHLKDVKNPNKMVKHYLDSQYGRHLHGNEHDASYVKKDFAHFKRKYKPEMHESLAVPLLGSMSGEKIGKTNLKKKMKKEQTDTPLTLPNMSVDVNTGRNV